MQPSPLRTYTCTDYREEMRLLALKRRLAQEELPEQERQRVSEEIARLEQAMAMN